MIDFSSPWRSWRYVGIGESPRVSLHSPADKDRINRARTLILPEDGRLIMERELYLSSINGMVYGENPKSGYLEGRTFYYPEMGISLVLPEGWLAEASPRRITLSSADGKGAYLLERNDNPVDLPTTVAKKAESLGKVRLLDQEKNPMDTFPSLRCRYSLLQEDSLLAVDVTGFRQEDRVVTLTALSEEKDYRSLSGAFRSVAMSIKPIGDQRKAKRQPRGSYSERPTERRSFESSSAGREWRRKSGPSWPSSTPLS